MRDRGLRRILLGGVRAVPHLHHLRRFGRVQAYVTGAMSACSSTITADARCGGGAATFEANYDAVAATFCE